MISLRKINTLLIIVIVIMLLNHAVLSILYLYGVISYSPNFQITGRRLFYPVVAHIIISMYLYFKDKSRGVNRYPNLISDTNQQVISGIMIIVFATLHILGYSFNPLGGQSTFNFNLYHFIVDNLLFVSIAMHLRVSIPKFMISFGFLDKPNAYLNFKRKVNWAVAAILIFLILGEVMYYIGGALW
ncbi:hypothetical protein [Methanobrevibacter sp.]|uniref:hypothetical protein n=1 Tax=Methanobrevibacter sp. TaxID=66852 RepID=UPI00388FC891